MGGFGGERKGLKIIRNNFNQLKKREQCSIPLTLEPYPSLHSLDKVSAWDVQVAKVWPLHRGVNQKSQASYDPQRDALETGNTR